MRQACRIRSKACRARPTLHQRYWPHSPSHAERQCSCRGWPVRKRRRRLRQRRRTPAFSAAASSKAAAGFKVARFGAFPARPFCMSHITSAVRFASTSSANDVGNCWKLSGLVLMASPRFYLPMAGNMVPLLSPKPMRAWPGFSHQPRRMTASPSCKKPRVSPLPSGTGLVPP